MGLLITVFVLQLVIHVVNTVGASTLNDLLWILWNRLPTPTAKAMHNQKRLQGEFFSLRKELTSTSSQDEFAKWAKLRRQYDKTLAELEKITQALSTSKASFEQSLGITRWIATNGFRLFLQFWYNKVAMFWIPRRWLPWYIEWLLAFPRAPTGSISIQIWAGACAAVIQLLSSAIGAVYALVTKQKLDKEKASPQQFGAGPGTSVGSSEPKKEL